MGRTYNRWRQYFYRCALIITCVNQHQRQFKNADVENEIVRKWENNKELTAIAADSGGSSEKQKNKKPEILGEHFSTRSFVKFSDFRTGSSVPLFVAQLASFSAALHHLHGSYDATVNTRLLGTNCHNGALSSCRVCLEYFTGLGHSFSLVARTFWRQFILFMLYTWNKSPGTRQWEQHTHRWHEFSFSHFWESANHLLISHLVPFYRDNKRLFCPDPSADTRTSQVLYL